MSIYIQDINSPSMEQISFFHDHAIIILILISILTTYIVASLLITNNFNSFVMEGQEIETIWTILPAFILVFIAFPSLNTLYIIEDTNTSNIIINTTGHQWYWSYEYVSINENESENFIETSNISRLLNTSEMLYIPIIATNRMLVSSEDVIHSWTVPSLGTNIDALPGRINQIFNTPNRIGLFTGQCSEICGANHSFIPITVQVLSSTQYINNINNI